ncbi:nucleoside hydrolase-like domain-containing protein [Aquiflexum sp.]|uniref:nucleoside hydrolase-like domain-containing protein n=1 Tax=Aquiflexum sp. TaxID=1872584 RepID=UPI0035943C7B
MKTILQLLLIPFFFISATGNLHAQEKPRVVIMTDMTHDDGNSLIRYLYYSHYFDTEAIIVTQQLPDFNYDQDGPWQKVNNILDAYSEEFQQLRKHHPEFPTYSTLKNLTKKGRGALPIIWLTNEKKFAQEIAGRYVESSWGDIHFHDWIGEGLNPNGESKDSEGSEYLQEIFDKEDDRPIFVQMWGVPITFVQALYRYKENHSEEKFQKLLEKLHIFGILLQDITFDYLIDLDKVQALKCTNMGTVTSTFEGDRVSPAWLLHDGGHFWKYIKVMQQSEVNGHGPMSEIYDHGGEGDTPAFLYLLSAVRGLNDPLEPTQGSWGSMFRPMGEDFPQGYYHTCDVDNQHLERWIPEVKNSFMNRLQYSIKNPDEVNHEPIAVLNGNKSNEIIRIQKKPGAVVKLDASGSYDPDGDELSYCWFYYKEAGTYPNEMKIEGNDEPVLELKVPADIGDNEIHLILEIKDNGNIPLVSYRRVILSGEK